MKIVYCISGLFNSGGMERIVSQKANWLADHGYDVTIVTVEQKNRQPFYSVDSKVKLIDLGINYWDHKNMKFFSKIFSSIKKNKLYRERLENTLKEIDPDIIISTFGHEYDFLYKIKGRAKIIAEIHFQRFFMLKANRKGLYRVLDYFRTYSKSRKIKRYDKFVVLTNEDLESWPDKRNIMVIPNSSPIPNDVSKQTEKRAIAVGRLSYPKNFQALIRMWKIVCESNKDWILDIYGDGDEKEELSNLINELRLESQVKLNGATRSIGDKYLESSIFLMTSRYEGFSLVLCEAMSYGLAPVAFACKCGPRDIIEDGKSGFLIEQDDIHAMAAKTIMLIEDSEKRKTIGNKAHHHIKDVFSTDAVMRQWITLFDSLLSYTPNK